MTSPNWLQADNKFLTRFNDCAIHFLKTLTNVFPQFTEFQKARTAINGAIKLKKNMALIIFISKVYPHREKILTKDKNFFMNCEGDDFNSETTDKDMEYIYKIRELIESEYMTKKYENTIWKFIQGLFMFADKYMFEYIGENYYEYITNLENLSDIMK